MLSFSSGRFLDAIRQSGKTNSFFMKMMSSFFHLSIVLSSSIIFGIISRLNLIFWPKYLICAISFLTLVYGVLLITATVASVWHTARIFNAAIDPSDGTHSE